MYHEEVRKEFGGLLKGWQAGKSESWEAWEIGGWEAESSMLNAERLKVKG